MSILVGAAIAAFVLIVEGYFLAKIIQAKLNCFSSSAPISLGILLFFALFELLVLPVVALRLATVIALGELVVMAVGIPLYCLIRKINCRPDRGDWIHCGIILAVIVIYSISSYNRTIGIESFDSSFYMSRVIENSSAPVLGGFEYKTGVDLHGLITTYDYQGFYYLYSMVLKLLRPLIQENMLVSVYVWGASFVYYAFMASALIDISGYLMKGWKRLILVCFAIPFLVNYYNTALAFIGNTYRTVAAALFIMLLYEYIKNKDRKVLFFASLCLVGGFSFSSSFLFMGAFILVGYFFYLVFSKENDPSVYFDFVLAAAPMAVLAALFSYNSEFLTTNVISYLIPVAYAILLILMTVLKRKNAVKTVDVLKKLFRVLFFVLLAVILYLSWLNRDSRFGYSFYFKDASHWDMLQNPFDFTTTEGIIRNTAYYVILLVAVISRKDNRFFRVIGIVFLLFGNPLTEPFVAGYLTNVVYARMFDIFINPFIICLCALRTMQAIKHEQAMLVPACLCVYASSITFTSIYNVQFIPSDNYDAVNRVDQEDVEIAEYIMEDTEANLYYRPVIISQTLSTKAFVSNCVSLLSKDDILAAPAYSDGTEHCDDEVLVTFYPYTYNGEVVWAEKPDYKNMGDIVIRNDVTYVVFRKDIVTQMDTGDYINAWFYLRDTCDLELETENYVVLKNKQK